VSEAADISAGVRPDGSGPDGQSPAGRSDGRIRSGRMRSGRRRSGRRPWRAAVLAGLGLAIIAGAAWALLGSSLLVVRHVQVRGNRLVSATAVLAVAGLRMGEPLARINTGAVARRIERITQVRSAQVSTSWPDTVVIVITERTPGLAVRSGGEYELIDADGVIVRTSVRRPRGLPVLTDPPPVLRGSVAVRAAVQVLHELPAAVRPDVRMLTASSAGSVDLLLRGGVTVRWGGTGQAAAKAAELVILLRTHARTVDVSDPGTAVTQG
jgi:cell division protein FtsQ